jgi:bifunctional UDP-N-acetylglucosamine pyrophosphorylase / glucosamine-1-phosphate N-acetyltransferase
MASPLPKVLQPLAGLSMLERVLRLLAGAGFDRPTVLVGYRGDLVRAAGGERCSYVDQGEIIGTGHAARVAIDALPPDTHRVLLIHGDEPLIPPEALREMLELQSRSGVPVVVLTTLVDDTRGFGRLVRDDDGVPEALRQEGELTPEQRVSLREVNLGAYVFDAPWLRAALTRLEPHPPKGEFYLTDVVAFAAEAARHGESAPPGAVVIPGGTDVMGVNDLVQLEEATRAAYRRTSRRHLLAGVRLVDAGSVYIGDDVRIAPGAVIHPFTLLEGDTTIGEFAEIGPHARLVDSHVGDGSRVIASTLEYARVGRRVTVGPYSHLRRGADVGDGVEIGNYAEIKGSTIGLGTKIHHMSYIGDAQIGANVNVGAGTVTANFDGRAKHRTVVEDEVHLGVDTMLRAPIRVGRGARTGAGAVVLHDVDPDDVVAGVPAKPLRRTQEDPT